MLAKVREKNQFGWLADLVTLQRIRFGTILDATTLFEHVAEQIGAKWMTKSFRTKPQHPLVELRNHILRLKKTGSPVHSTPRSRAAAPKQKPLQTTRALRGKRHA